MNPMEPHDRPDLSARAWISSSDDPVPPPPRRSPGGLDPRTPGTDHASERRTRHAAANRRRRRRLRGAGVAVAVAVALAGGGVWTLAGSTGARTVAHRATAAPVRNQVLSASTIAAQDDAAIVDIVTLLGYPNGQAAGTGIVLTSTGEILTNNHVIQGSTSITVKISSRAQTFKATVVGTDAAADIAVLQAQGASGLTTAPLGTSSGVTVGQPVVAIGNALNKPGLPTVTEGTVTALARSISVRGDNGAVEHLQNLVETNAPLQPGNSGGPLLDTSGQVIGINTAASAGTIPDGGTTDGFAIPINDAVTIARQIESGHGGATVHIGATPFLGVQVRAATPNGFDRGSGSGTPGGSGVPVIGVEPRTPAQAAGIGAGDQITAVGGVAVSSQADLTQALSGKHPGDTVAVTWVDQANARHQASVRLATGPAA